MSLGLSSSFLAALAWVLRCGSFDFSGTVQSMSCVPANNRVICTMPGIIWVWAFWIEAEARSQFFFFLQFLCCFRLADTAYDCICLGAGEKWQTIEGMIQAHVATLRVYFACLKWSSYDSPRSYFLHALSLQIKKWDSSAIEDEIMTVR